MELEEALVLIETLKKEVIDLKDNDKTSLSDLTKTHEKALQVSYNKGFDKAKNASDDKMKDGYVSKEDVDKMLSDRDTIYRRQSTLSKMGVKNPKRALKLIDEDDLKSFETEDFKEEDFIKKYGEDIVFIGNKLDEIEDPKKSPSNFMKNNDKQKNNLTAENYQAMSTAERSKISTAEKLALL